MIEGHQELNTAIEVAKAAGSILKSNFGKKYHVIRKSPKEMVTEIDMKSQRIVSEMLTERYPSYGLITEEKLFSECNVGKTWIIDPIDGTHNYIAGLPFSGVSIALADSNEYQVGVVYFPMEEELYCAVHGQGAYCNSKPIFVSDNNELSKAIVNFDNQFHLSSRSFECYKELIQKAFTTRIFGVATKDLCLTASGKIDGRVWMNTKIYDVAAGAVILKEAGGKITNFDGSPLTMDSSQVVSSNGKIHEELLAIFEEKNK